VATYTYTTDQRFQTTHHKTTDEWTMQIKWSQPRDAGMYECQVSSQPIKSFFVNLNVAGKFDNAPRRPTQPRIVYLLIYLFCLFFQLFISLSTFLRFFFMFENMIKNICTNSSTTICFVQNTEKHKIKKKPSR
jgi:hypothetical protein